MPDNTETAGLITQLEPLLPSAVATLRDYFHSEDGNKAARDRARIGLQFVNTAINLQRAAWTQQRHETGIARVLADGDLDVFQHYVQNAMPTFPQIRKAALSGTDG